MPRRKMRRGESILSSRIKKGKANHTSNWARLSEKRKQSPLMRGEEGRIALSRKSQNVKQEGERLLYTQKSGRREEALIPH